MALDDRDYMKERAAARFDAWLREGEGGSQQLSTSHTRASAPMSLRRLKAGFLFFLGWLSLIGMLLYLVSLQAPPPSIPPAPAAATIETQSAEEPATSTSAPLTAEDKSGRLYVVSPKGRASSIVRISKDAEQWDGYVRSGETAQIELMPASYLVELLDPVTLARQASPLRIDIPSAGTEVTLTLGRSER